NRDIGSYIMYGLRSVSAKGLGLASLWSSFGGVFCGFVTGRSLNSGRTSRCVGSLFGIPPLLRKEIRSLVKPASRASLKGTYPTGQPYGAVLLVAPPHTGSMVAVAPAPTAPRVRGWTRSIDASTPNCII